MDLPFRRGLNMKITEMIELLAKTMKEHGDIPVFLADRFFHYDVKRANFSDATDGPHFCIRMQDDIKYGER